MKPILLHNANFITFRKVFKKIKGLLIVNGLIKNIITENQSEPRYAKKIDLHGNFVVPGFIDSHTHLISWGVELQRINLEDCRSPDDCLERLRSALHNDSELIFGVNWDESLWANSSLKIQKTTLDQISKHKPIIMRRICGHFAIANTKTLNMIPKHWQIVDRENGFLYGDVALNLNDIFKPDIAMLDRAIQYSTAEALKKGITSVHEICNLDQFRLLQMAQKSRRLKIRFSVFLPLKCLRNVTASGMGSRYGNDYLRFAGIKVFLDGSVGARTAAFGRPYENTRITGRIFMSGNGMKKIIKQAETNQVQLMLHSIGDRTSATILKVLQKSISKNNPLRHRLEHVELLDKWSIQAMARMKIIASMQPNFVRRWQNPGGMYEKYLGTRYKRLNCFKLLEEKDIKIAFGSDCMPLGPLYGIRGACSHPFKCGRINLTKAFKMYTENGAYATFDEKKKGSIDIGKLADLVVLDKNPLTARNLDKTTVLMTMVGGKIMYHKHNLTE